MKNEIGLLINCLLVLRWTTPIFVLTGLFWLNSDVGALGVESWFVAVPVFIIRMACFISFFAVVFPAILSGFFGPHIVRKLYKKAQFESSEIHK
jgi:hypothetical protein